MYTDGIFIVLENLFRGLAANEDSKVNWEGGGGRLFNPLTVTSATVADRLPAVERKT